MFIIVLPKYVFSSLRKSNSIEIGRGEFYPGKGRDDGENKSADTHLC
jgi:hypothetical protein